MQYTTSEHYRENPFTEVDTALKANSYSIESVQTTLQARFHNEMARSPLDTKAIERVKTQLAYIGSLATAQELQVA